MNSYETNYLETDRLILKDGTIEDWVKVHEYDFNFLMNIDGVFEYVKRDPEEVRSWFVSDDFDISTRDKNLEIKSNNENIFDFIIFIKENMLPIGYISFDRNNDILKSTEVACYIHPDYWRNGYMTEALVGCMDYLFNKGFENIIYSYDKSNIKSKKLCEKVGFRFLKETHENNCFGNYSVVYNNIMSKEEFGRLYELKKVKVIKND